MSFISNIKRPITSTVSRIASVFSPSATAWRGASRALLGLSAVLIGLFFYFEVAHFFWLGRLLGFLVLLAIVGTVALATQFVWWFLSTLPTRFRLIALFTFALCLVYGMALWGMPGGLQVAFGLVVMLSLAFGALASLRAGMRRSFFGVPTFLSLGVGVAGLAAGSWFLLQPAGDINPWLASYVFEDRTLDLPNPGEAGPFEIESFTYGSGADLHRSEFAKDVTYKTKSVDGSKLVDRWEGAVGWARTKFWGFDHTELPVQGRAWMPKGMGPFPLVLIVHGNHGMEDFSDPGYEYLGRHFASRGIVTVSVDENFLNGSNADMLNPIEPGIGAENDARGWMMLNHLAQWRDWMTDEKHPLYGKVDMERLALIGHSRGGEAVAIAAAFNALDHYPDDASQEFDFGFDLKGVIAIAPADGQYNPRKNKTPLVDTNYFVIHGSMDGDVQSMMGASQMSRVKFSGDTDVIKASLYVEGANHGQFNTSWGRYDFGLPFSWLFNLEDIMDPEEQRQIAKVYFSAFLETVLNDTEEYLPLLGDPRKGAAWLPDQFLVSNLVTSQRQIIADYEEDIDVVSTSFAMAKITAENLVKWREEWVSLKWNPLDTHVAIIAWDRQVEEKTGTYGYEWTAGSLGLGEESAFVFAAADAGEGTKPKGWEAPESADEDESEEAGGEDPAPLDWTLVLTDVYGNEARLALSHDALLTPQVNAHTRKLEVLASIEKSELVWRRFAFPVKDFLAANPDVQPTALVSLHFEFDKSEAGAIVIDDFGLE